MDLEDFLEGVPCRESFPILGKLVFDLRSKLFDFDSRTT